MEDDAVNRKLLLRIELQMQMQNALLFALAETHPDRAQALAVFRAYADPIQQSWNTISGLFPRQALEHALSFRTNAESALADENPLAH